MTVGVEEVSRAKLQVLLSTSGNVCFSEEERNILDLCFCSTTKYWVGKVDAKLVCFWGLIPPTLMSDRAYLWLYTTEALTDHVFLFVRYSQRMVEEMLKEYPTITGHVVMGQERSKQWLEWLGARFFKPQGRLVPFEIRAKNG